MKKKNYENLKVKSLHYIIFFMVVLALVKHFMLNSIYRAEERPTIVVCEETSDREGYTIVCIEEVTEKEVEDFKDATLVLDNMGSKLNKKHLFYI